MNHNLTVIEHWSKQWKVNFNPNKTDVVLFNGSLEKIDINLQFDNTVLTSNDIHKHLGVTLNENGKWETHISNIAISASRHLSVLPKLKFTLKKEILSKLYIVFIRPLLEYASEVWDGCTIANSDKLEKIQLEAARIVTGLTSFASKQSLYLETGYI